MSPSLLQKPHMRFSEAKSFDQLSIQVKEDFKKLEQEVLQNLNKLKQAVLEAPRSEDSEYFSAALSGCSFSQRALEIRRRDYASKPLPSCGIFGHGFEAKESANYYDVRNVCIDRYGKDFQSFWNIVESIIDNEPHYRENDRLFNVSELLEKSNSLFVKKEIKAIAGFGISLFFDRNNRREDLDHALSSALACLEGRAEPERDCSSQAELASALVRMLGHGRRQKKPRNPRPMLGIFAR